jgi:hypothetical protein
MFSKTCSAIANLFDDVAANTSPDVDIDKVARYCFNINHPRQVMGISAEASLLQMNPRSLQDIILDLAATVHYTHIALLSSYISTLANEVTESRLQPIASFRFFMADETTLPASTKGRSHERGNSTTS